MSSPRAALTMRTPLLHFRNGPGVDHLPRLRTYCRVERDKVAFGQKLIERHEFHGQFSCRRFADEWIKTRQRAYRTLPPEMPPTLPMRPRPMRPRVLPRTSAPDDDFSQRPSRIAASNLGSWRTSANNSAKVCSATLTELPPGVLMTRTPRFVASSKSILSTAHAPARPTARNFYRLV